MGCNRGALDLYGYIKKELIGKHVTELMSKNSLSVFEEKFPILKKLRSTECEIEIVRKNGEKRKIWRKSVSLVDEDGNFSGALCYDRDITRRKEIEMQLRESEHKYRSISETIRDVIFTLDRSGKFTYLSPRFENLTGYSPGEFIGRSFTEVLAPEHVEPTLEKFRRGLRGEEIPLYEVEILHRDGRRIPVELSVTSLVDTNGKIIGRLGVARDIRDRKKMEQKFIESEEKFRTLAEKSLIGIYLMQDGVFKYVNPKFAEIFGYSTDEIIDKMKPQGLVHPEDWKIVEENIGRRISGELDSIRYNFIGIRKDGKVVFIEAYGSRIMYRGKPAILGSLLDITDRKKAEDELKKAHEKLKRAYRELKSIDELKDNIIENVSHELRTPITIAKGMIELSMEEEDPEKRRKYLESAIKALIRQNRVVGDLIEMARFAKKCKKFEIKKLDLNPIISLVLRRLEPLALEKKVKIDVRISPSLPNIEGDAEALHRAIYNLMHNAVKFNREGGRVVVKAAQKNNFVEVCIKDTGIGIPKEKLDKIFDPLFQVDSSTSRRYSGTGIGFSGG
ncbi:MAG: hypothetical protein DRN25_04475 [Thermoplasmata archaeon]|nr:MAG: hypothetical protein DRN25_04475 [Thermoplasmata archaeon]